VTWGLQARGGSSWTHIYTYGNSQVSYVHAGGNFTLITKDFQWKESSLGSQGMGKAEMSKVL
jgi:hypothetical protein